MSDATVSDNATAAEITHDEYLHRALLYKRMVNEDNDQIKPEAFLRRRDVEGRLTEDYLSVDRAVLREANEFADSFRKCFGVVSILAGQIRELGLDVEPRAEPQIILPMQESQIGQRKKQITLKQRKND